MLQGKDRDAMIISGLSSANCPLFLQGWPVNAEDALIIHDHHATLKCLVHVRQSGALVSHEAQTTFDLRTSEVELSSSQQRCQPLNCKYYLISCSTTCGTRSYVYTIAIAAEPALAFNTVNRFKLNSIRMFGSFMIPLAKKILKACIIL